MKCSLVASYSAQAAAAVLANRLKHVPPYLWRLLVASYSGTHLLQFQPLADLLAALVGGDDCGEGGRPDTGQ